MAHLQTWPREPTYRQRIEALRIVKNRHTEAKIDLYGYFDTDDHGYIPWTEPIPFEAVPNHPSGGCYGIRAIGESFRRWLEVHPVYINPMSSLAGAWVYKGIPGVGGWQLSTRQPQRAPGQSKLPQQAASSPGNWRPEDRPLHLFPLHARYNIYNHGIGSANHLGPDMSIGLALGWGGLLEKVRAYRERNRPPDTSFYDGTEQLLLGVQAWIGRHVDRAREMAAAETDPVLHANLVAIAEANEWLLEGPPRTLREACQFLAWFQCIDRMWGLGGALGQLDELLRPYYEADVAAGREDDASVVWHLASLFSNDPHYSQIGGQAPDGRDLTSPMSFLILEAMHRLRTPSNIALRVHEGMDRDLLRRAVTYLCEDGTGVSFACAKGLDEGFARNGHPMALARMRAKVGCNWTALPGIEYCLQDVTRVCLVTPLMLALGDLLADGSDPRTMDLLWEHYARHLGTAVAVVKEGKDLHMAHQADNWPEIVLNLFCHGPIERGVDASAGGVDIVDLAIDGIGLATAADSFAAIEQRVVAEGRLTWEELAAALETDFCGAERVRLMLNSIPRYGSGGAAADTWAQRIGDLWSHLVRDAPTPAGFTCVPGLFSHGGTNRYGKQVEATPNGRHAGEPLSHSADPDLMIRVTGYSAYFRSLSREYRQPIVDRILAEG